MFLIWTMLIVVMMGIAFGAAPVFIFEMINLRKSFGLKKWRYLVSFVFASAFAATSAYFSKYSGGLILPDELVNRLHILLDNGCILVRIVGITFLVQIPIFITVFLIGPAADRIRWTGDKRSIEAARRQFQMLENVLRGCLQILAVLVVFSVLTSSALRESLKAIVEIEGFDIFPKEASYVYGLLFSFFLAMIYIPVHYYLKFRAKQFIDHLSSEELEASESKWLDEIKESMRMRGTGLEQIKLGLTIFAPILTSLIPDLSHLF